MIWKPAIHAIVIALLLSLGSRGIQAQQFPSNEITAKTGPDKQPLYSAQPVGAADQESDPLQGFDEYVNKALRDWQVPGLAIAVVKNDKVVFARGYGVRKLGQPGAVDDHTLFAIGSASKAFTAASVAMLVDDGKVKWDEPATSYLKGFQLFDPYVTREITVRDLLCHRSGLVRGDGLWYGTGYSRDEILRRVRFLKPTWGFRTTFGYQNIMFLAAGQIIPAITGKSWDEFVKERIFTPLGMTSSSTSITALGQSNNVASPHSEIDDKVIPVNWRNIDNVGPAGSINSNVTDMAQWVRLQLGEGSYNGSRLISSGSVKEMHTPQMLMRAEPPFSLLSPEAHFLAYGFGWFLADYKGRKIVQHGGNIDGMSAVVAMVPEEKLGLVILTNMNGTLLTDALMYKVFDLYMGAPARDWSTEFKKTIDGFRDQGKAAQKKAEAERVSGTKPSLPLEQYAGSYENEMYGEVKVFSENGRLVVRSGPNFTGDLEHWHFDTFRVTWRDPMEGKGLLSFGIDTHGKVEELKWPDRDPFKRVAEKAEPAAGASLTEAELKAYTGTYESKTPPIEISIEIIGGKLKANVPGQPVYTLVPIGKERFQIEGAPSGFNVRFEQNGDKVKTMVVEQATGPSLTLTLKRQ